MSRLSFDNGSVGSSSTSVLALTGSGISPASVTPNGVHQLASVTPRHNAAGGHNTTSSTDHSDSNGQVYAFRNDFPSHWTRVLHAPTCPAPVWTTGDAIGRRTASLGAIGLSCNGRSLLSAPSTPALRQQRIGDQSGGDGNSTSASGRRSTDADFLLSPRRRTASLHRRRPTTTLMTSSSRAADVINNRTSMTTTTEDIEATARRHIWSCHVPGSVKWSSRIVCSIGELYGALMTSPKPLSASRGGTGNNNGLQRRRLQSSKLIVLPVSERQQNGTESADQPSAENKSPPTTRRIQKSGVETPRTPSMPRGPPAVSISPTLRRVTWSDLAPNPQKGGGGARGRTVYPELLTVRALKDTRPLQLTGRRSTVL